ncbi:signal transduction protein [Oceanococcus atlanticus]|uniref:Signal transduction protein n=1 Tax=Oceanococcus atlanticus TaxID=1317117 RepID=A0A1Y1SEF2_9GAMM|nr:CBS domain-containing protein [Oceanococcus atlanticus]ORE87053.1 signal transduction protein [Oceanococcus atlanticus]RZO86805.1 MAG: CBS domain-containing protein [Oceanococcus sp.]
MKELKFSDAGHFNRLIWPDHGHAVGVDSAATSLMTDFARSLPMVIGGNIRIADARAEMKHQHTGFKCVVDEHDEFIGVVGLDDLNDQEVVKKVASGFERAELSVADFMCPKRALRAMSYVQIAPMRVYALLWALRGCDGHHCLVLDDDANAIRGLVAASDVVQRMGLPLDPWSASFVDIWMCLSQQHSSHRSA